jgi:hypothetical protein
MQILRVGARHNMSIDTAKLENVRQRGGRIVAACPACRESGADRSGEHLVILDGGKWGCIANTGDAGREHRRRIAQLAGDGDSTSSPRPFIPRPTVKPTCKPVLPLVSVPSADDLKTIARVRGWHTADGMEVLAERGLLFTGLVYDDGQSWPAWIVTDSTRRNAQARRMDGNAWTGIGAKAKSLPGTTAARCIGAAVIGERPEVWLVEGTPDLCAAPIVARLAGLDLDRIAFVCVTGAGNSLHADDLPYFIGKRVTVAMHADGAGAVAANRWASQLYQAGAREVVGFDFAGIGKDLSDYLKSLSATVTPNAPPSLPEAKQPPAGYCPACWSSNIVAPLDGPTCQSAHGKPIQWPDIIAA